MTGVVCALAGGTPDVSYTGSATVTVGLYAPGGSNSYGYLSGLGSPPGAIAPSTWAYSRLPFRFLYWSDGNFISFEVIGLAPNSGWSTLNIAGTDYSRSAASYSYDGSATSWLWNSITANPFGTTTGATKVATWS